MALTRHVFLKPVLALLALLSIAACARASTEKLTASQWPALSEQRKLYYVLGQMESYEDEGVVFDHSPADYLELLNSRVKTGVPPKTDMDAVFRSFVAAEESLAPLKKN